MPRFHRYKRRRPTLQDAEDFHKKGSFGYSPSRDGVSLEERRKRIEELSATVQAKARQTLSTVRNLELVVLKCHLLVEYMLNQFIDLTARTEGVIDNERFTFSQKETLVHLLGFPPDPLFFPSVDLLNRIRNQVAHTLDLDRRLIDQLIRINSEDPDIVTALTDAKRATALKQITRFLCGQMVGVITAMQADELYSLDDVSSTSKPKPHHD
jgi:hypothetical protein